MSRTFHEHFGAPPRPASLRQQSAHASYAAERRFGDHESDAVARLVATVPQTLQGAAAMLAYVRERYAQGYPMCEEEECMTLLGSIECAVCKAAGLPKPTLAARQRSTSP